MSIQSRNEDHPANRSLTEQRPITGGEWFMKILQANDVEYIFGTTGRGMSDIQDAMTVVKPPIWIQGLHEFPTVAAASGYALASERTAVCLIDRVVGTVNALGAFYIAHQNYAPVVVFASQNLPTISSGSLSDGRSMPGSHYHSWQSVFTTPWTKWRYELSNPELLPSSVLKALMIAKTEPQGLTYMTLRQDLMAQTYKSAPTPAEESSFSLGKRASDWESIEAAAKFLVEAERPIIWATCMGRHVSAVPKLVELAEALGCGVFEGRVFLNFPTDHPLFLGFRTAREGVAEKPDVLLNVESYYEPPTRPPEGCAVIDLYPDPAMLQGSGGGDYGGTFYSASVRLVGDSTNVLSQLISSVGKRLAASCLKATIEERFERNRARHEKLLSSWGDEAQKHLHDDPVSEYKIAYELNRLWDDETIWVDGSMTARRALRQGIILNKSGTYFTNPSSHLGPAASMAYGVALARPKERVVATMGDGDFVFGNPLSALWTCSHYHIPVLYLVFNNACWGVEWPYLMDTTLRLAAKHKDYECVDLDEPRIRFKSIAEGLGVHAEIIEHPDDASDKLRLGFELISKGEPALIEINLRKHTDGPSSYKYIFRRSIPLAAELQASRST